MTVAVTLAVVGLALTRISLAQTSDAVCDPSFDWAKNPKGDSPCTVGASLLAVCSETHTWIVPKLAPGNTYRAPNSTEVNPCQCSTVTFSLLAACSLCQNATPVTFTRWSTDCKQADITINDFPFTNQTTEIPIWSRANTTSDGKFDLQEAMRLVGVAQPEPTSEWPVRDIVLVSLGIASAFFLTFLAIFCFCRRHRIAAYWGKKKRASKGRYAPIDPSKKRGRVKRADTGAVYALDLDAPTSRTQSTTSYTTSPYEDPFGYQDRSVSPLPPAHHRNTSGSGPYSETSKPYAGPSTASLTSSSRVHPTDNMMKHPASTSTVNVVHRESGGASSSHSTTPSFNRNLEPPRTPGLQQQPTSPPATQTGFGSHPAHHAHERTASSSSTSLPLVRPGHRTTPSGSSLRGYEQGPSAPLFSRKKQVANKRKDTDFSIDGPSSSSSRPTSDSSWGFVDTPSSATAASPPALTNNFARQPLYTIPASSEGATFSPSSRDGLSSGATLVHHQPGPLVMQVNAPSSASGTLVSHHGRIEHASHHAEIGNVEDEEEARMRWEELPRPTGERDPFATLRALAVDSDPDLRLDLDARNERWRRESERDPFGDDFPRR
ncbi:hypothetical protein EXIGLDRAFT_716487 [Exidia glandulosa HHB12029]|uniref:Uncharacterized protein n=1 Tax=Exidia glandulosa HHB12029 TaxID=1314781 RepID=A0A165P9I1_EXIGL|nr:hypothetical protein EXIGLDRAFT_716487 [Exidia glandulosa HHB12029]